MNHINICVLPTELKKAIDNFQKYQLAGRQSKDKRTRNNLYQFFTFILFKASYTNGITLPVHCHHLIIKKLIGKDYARLLRLLQAAKLIYINHCYLSPQEAARLDMPTKSKEYAVNAKFINDTFDLISVPLKNSLREKYTEGVKETITKKHFFKLMKNVTISIREAKKLFAEHLKNQEHLINHSIRYDINKHWFKRIYFFDYKSNTYKILKNKSCYFINRYFSNKDRIFIQSNSTYYFISRTRFEQMRTLNVLFSYTLALRRLYHNQVFALREMKTINNDGKETSRPIRFHTSITNLPNLFTGILTYQRSTRNPKERFKSIDLSNSQFVFLAYCLSKPKLKNRISKLLSDCQQNGQFKLDSKGAKDFIQQAQKGTLYETIAATMGIKRQTAKQVCFEVLFAPDRNSEEIQVFSKMYSEIIIFLNYYKKVHGYKELSKELQFVEASVMIDGVLKSLITKGIYALTKHDSFMCPASQFEQMKAIVIAKLNRRLGKDGYNYKEE